MEQIISTEKKCSEDRIQKLEQDLVILEQRIKDLQQQDSVSIVCFSGEWDKLFAAFTIANGALSLGKEVHMFFTFWGATAMRDEKGTPSKNKNISQKMLGWMLPKSIKSTHLSKMNFGGFGKKMMEQQMKKQNIDDLPTLMKQAKEFGANFYCCDTSLQLLGFDCNELIEKDDTDWCGVSSFLSLALKSRVTLFI